MVSGTISHSLPGSFSPFPHGTGSLSVTREYLALRDGPSRIPTGFHVSRCTQDPERREPGFVYWTITISGVASQPLRLPDSLVTPKFSPKTPLSKLSGLGSSRFARRYSGNRIFFLPAATKTFQFTGIYLLAAVNCIAQVIIDYDDWVSHSEIS